MKESEKFPYTAEGYKLAKEWLKSIDKWEYVSTRGFSTDGWSAIHEANSMYERMNKYCK